MENFMVKDLLSLKIFCNVIEGTVSVAKLAVEPGATFNAACTMGKGAVATATKIQPTKANEPAKVS